MALAILGPLVLLGALTVVAEGPIVGRSYRFSKVLIDATIEPDGTLVLKERRTFDFQGAYHGAFFTIDPTHAPVQNIEGFTIREGGTRYDYDQGFSDAGGFKATWFFEAADERRAFTISYRVRCAVDVYDDTAHLNWQFIGRDWTEPTDLARVTLHVPGRASGTVRREATCPNPLAEARRLRTRPLAHGDVRAWGHGPLSGEVALIDPQTVILTVRDLDPYAFVEGSVVFPRASVATAAEAPGGPGLDGILARERREVEEANALRSRHDLLSALTRVLWFLAPALILLMLVVGALRDREPEVPRTLQEPPSDIHPVKLTLMWNTYRKDLGARDAYRAQFMHLVRQGAVELHAVGTVSDPEDIQIRRGREPEDEMDRAFMRFLFAGGEEPTIKRLRARGERKERLTEWWKVVGTKTRRTVKKIAGGRARAEAWGMGALAIGASVYGFWAWTGFREGFEPLGLVGADAAWLIPISLAAWLLAVPFLRPLPPPGVKRQIAEWRAFRRFLTTFSTLDDAPALAVVIWERYLVYAVALGVADRVEKQVRALVPEEQLDDLNPENVPDGGTSWVHRVTHQPAHVAAGAAATVGWSSGWGGGSSSGGGGGGFSGGGGGGGGGTGGGAF